MPTRIDTAFSPEFFQQFIEATDALRNYNNLMKEASKQHISVVSAGAPDSVAGLVKALENLTKVTENNRQATQARNQRLSEQQKLQERLIYLATDEAKKNFELRGEVNQLSATMRNAAKDVNDIGGAYGKLSRQFTESALAAKNMVLELGKNHPQAMQAIKDANALNDKLKELDASVGQNNRNVGDYTRATAGLQRTFGQLASELPSLNNGFKTFASAISNNLTPFINELKAVVVATKEAKQAARDNADQQGEQAKLASLAAGSTEEVAQRVGELAKQQALAAAEGTKGNGVLKALGSALFSFNTLITVGVTLFTIYGPKLIDWITGNRQASETIKKLTEDTKQFTESLAETGAKLTAQAAADAAQLQALALTAKDTSRSMADRTEAVRQLLNLYPEYLSSLTQEDILNGRAANSIRLASRAIFARAEAEANRAQAQESAKRVAEIDAQIAEATNKKLTAQKAYDDYIKGSSSRRGSLTARSMRDEVNNLNKDLVTLSVARVQAQQQQVNFFQAERNATTRVEKMTSGIGPQGRTADVIQRDLDDVNRLIRQYGAAFKNARGVLADQREGLETELDKFLGKKDRNQVKTNTSAASSSFTRTVANDEDLTAALYDELIIRANGEARHQKRVADNEKNALDDRILAYDKFTSLQLRSLYLSEAKEKKIIQDKLDEITRIEGIAVSKRLQSENNLVARKGVLQQQLANVTAATQEKQTDIIETSEKAQTKITEDEIKKRMDAEKLARENFGSVKINPSNNSRVGRTQTREEAERERFEEWNYYTQNAISISESLFDIERARSQQRLDDINEEINAINKKRDADISAVENSFASEADKKKRIAEINARASAQEQEQEEKARIERRKSAEQEKAINVARIAILTALAVADELTKGDPYTKIVRAVAVGVIGAAQLAAAIAVPIPQFRTGKGKGNNYEGVAKVGDGGPELLFREDGSVEYASKETLTYLGKNDIVKTAAETDEIFKYFGVGLPSLRTKEGKDYAMDMIMQDVKEGIVSAIDRKRFPTQKVAPPWYEIYYTNRNR